MVIRDPQIEEAIKKLGVHYRNNIDNKYIKKAFNTLQLDTTTWELIRDLTKETDYPQEYRLDELYERILALAEFVYKARQNIVPTIRNLVDRSGSLSGNDKLMQDIAISNFSSNLGILSDLVYDLYLKTVEIDKRENENTKKVYERTPELTRLGEWLMS